MPSMPKRDAIVPVGDVIGGEAGAENLPNVRIHRAARDPELVVEGVSGIALVAAVVGEELLVADGADGGADEGRRC